MASRDSVSSITDKPAARWVIYSAFDARGRSSDSAVAQVREHRECGFKVLIVDTSPLVSAERLADWNRESSLWFQRPNVGYDFGSFKAGLQYLLDNGHASSTRPLDLVIANDSCFGPFTPLSPIIERFDRFASAERRIFGITDSIQLGHHLQSYWVYFRSDTVQLAFRFLLETMQDAADREDAIRKGELALGRFLASEGCVLEAACPMRRTMAQFACFNGWLASTIEFGSRRLFKRWKYGRDADTQCLRMLLGFPDHMKHFNPALLFGVELYRRQKMPFLKKSMFRDNVYGNPRIPPGLDVSTMTNADVRALLG